MTVLAHALLGNGQRLDGGAMFGNVPRALWSRWCEPDAAGTIPLACRTLLIEDGDRKVLLEAGVGAFLTPELRERYGIQDGRHVLLDSLADRGCSHEDEDVVVLSHLHFDHAGGLLSRWEPDSEPSLLFPNARFVVGAEALERARTPHARDRASFIPGMVEQLEATGRVVVVDSERCDLLGERYHFRESHGHTPGMLHTLVSGERGQIFFCADLVPGTPWVHLPVTMGYDRFPERLIDEKQALFDDVADTPTWLFFTHDPAVAAAQIGLDPAGRYRTLVERSDFGQGLELA